MRKTINFFAMLLTALSIFNFTLSAQNIPNAGFENWTSTGFPAYQNPNNWGTINASTNILGILTIQRASAAGEFRSGQYALKAITRHVSAVNRTASGITVTGTVNTQAETTEGGFVYTQRPTSLNGWYRYSPQGTDNCDISVVLWRRVGGVYEEIGSGQFTNSTTVSSFTQFVIPINYVSTATPDSAKIVIVSSNSSAATQANDNSTLWVDDLAFVNCAGFSVAANTTNVTTVGGNNGSATAVVTGGTASFNYLWSTGATSASVTNISQGNYCVTVTDANGCTASACGAVSEPSCAGVSLSINTTDVTTNGGSDGSATAVTSGTTGTVVYEWAPGGATSSSISNLTAGIYSVTITDGVGCTATANGTVSSPACSGFSVLVSGTSVTVFQGSNGTATTDVSGGQTPFSYSWSNSATTEDINALPVGTYCVTVTDDNNCSVSDCVTIVEDIDCSTFEVSVNTTPATSANGTDGTAESVVTNENGNVIYIWSNSATTPILNDLSSGNYCVTATDEAGCTATACEDVTFTVGIENNQLAYQIFPNPTQGKLFIQLESAATYTFTVFDMNGKIVSNIAFETHETTISISTLTNGMYFYEIKNTTNGLSQKGKFLKN